MRSNPRGYTSQTSDGSDFGRAPQKQRRATSNGWVVATFGVAALALVGMIAAAFAGDVSDPRTLTDWAEALHCSNMSIRRAFRQETGISFSEWRTRRRLAVSMLLLRSGSPVSSAAYAVGLTHNGLIAAYRRHLGAPPSSFTLTPSDAP